MELLELLSQPLRDAEEADIHYEQDPKREEQRRLNLEQKPVRELIQGGQRAQKKLIQMKQRAQRELVLNHL